MASLDPQLVIDIINGHLKAVSASFYLGNVNVQVSNDKVSISIDTAPKNK